MLHTIFLLLLGTDGRNLLEIPISSNSNPKAPFLSRQSVTPIQPLSGNIKCSYLAFTLVGMLGLGTPAQSFAALFDTGSSLFWVRSSLCNSSECVDKRRFDTSASSSFRDLPIDTPQSILYGDGTRITCQVDEDRITLGAQVFTNNVCVATNIVTPTASIDSIVGLSPPGGTGFFKITIDRRAYVPSALFASLNRTDSKISFWYNRAQNITNNGDAGEITIGGVDTKLFKGSIDYIDITTDRSHWSLQLTEFTLDGSSNMLMAPQKVLIDTGTTVALLPDLWFAELNKNLGAVPKNGIYYVDCSKVNNLKTITLRFGSSRPMILKGIQQVVVDLEGQTCLSVFQPLPASASSIGPIFGALFLRQFYTVFDFGTAQIGFAAPADDPIIQLPPETQNSADDRSVRFDAIAIYIMVMVQILLCL